MEKTKNRRKAQPPINRRQNIKSTSQMPDIVTKELISKRIGNKLNPNPVKLRSGQLAEKFRAAKVSEYLYGAIHPQEAVKEGLDVKLPTDLPIPSACVRVTATYAITTGANGNLFVNYTPGSLLLTNNTQGIVSTLSVNTTCTGSGTAGTNTLVTLPYADVPQVYDKWRLTAAEMRVSYVGQVLNQTGAMWSAVHYEPVGYGTVGTGGGAFVGQTNPNVDRLSGNFNLIKQGLWNDYCELTSNSHGITHIWTPSSNNDYGFTGSVGATATTAYGIVGLSQINVPAGQAPASTTIVGTTVRGFSWAINNLPINSNCMMFTTYEVYEYLPDIGAVPILRLTEDSPTREEYNNIISSVPKTRISEQPRSSFKNFISGVHDAVMSINSKIDIPSLLTKVVSAIL